MWRPGTRRRALADYHPPVRRTIAWHIANRPFGTIAGMIQYKHASVAAFEGYAGSSRSGFWTTSRTNSASGERRLTVKVTRGLGKFGYAHSLNFQNGLETDAREY